MEPSPVWRMGACSDSYAEPSGVWYQNAISSQSLEDPTDIWFRNNGRRISESRLETRSKDAFQRELEVERPMEPSDVWSTQSAKYNTLFCNDSNSSGNSGDVSVRFQNEGLSNSLAELGELPRQETRTEDVFLREIEIKRRTEPSSVWSMQSVRPYTLCLKGHISLENLGDRHEVLGGVGVALYDGDDVLVLRVSKPLEIGLSRVVAEYTALAEGLSAAMQHGVRHVKILGDGIQLFNQVTGRWTARQRKIKTMHEVVCDLIQKLDEVSLVLIPRCENHFALTLAREAINSQLIKSGINPQQRRLGKENCSICLENVDANVMHEISPCMHRYCPSCMSQHVEVKLNYSQVPQCPYLGCNSKLSLEDCKRFLSLKWSDVLKRRFEEAVIPDSEKAYCPYTDCSVLIVLTSSNRTEQSVLTSDPLATGKTCFRCWKCSRDFCVDCRVPWHSHMSCTEYQTQASALLGIDANLHTLADEKKWRRCRRCRHMIELSEGCNHMTCRCGFEFCYVCGAEWKNEKATCTCRLFDENSIIREPADDEMYFVDDFHDIADDIVSEDELWQ